jgi:N utilization substance protein B
VDRDGHRRAAVLRLAARQARRRRRGPAARDRARPARAVRARDRRRADDARSRHRRAPQRGVHERPLHDELPRGGSPPPARARGGRRRTVARGRRVSSRRQGRRTAFFLLYQWDVTGQPLASLYEGDVDEFARSTAEAVAARAAELDARITAAAEGWTADRLGAVERNVLRLAVHELEGGEVPVEVAIDEAVTLAKRYASPDAGRLVNGILGRIAREREVA